MVFDELSTHKSNAAKTELLYPCRFRSIGNPVAALCQTTYAR